MLLQQWGPRPFLKQTVATVIHEVGYLLEHIIATMGPNAIID